MLSFALKAILQSTTHKPTLTYHDDRTYKHIRFEVGVVASRPSGRSFATKSCTFCVVQVAVSVQEYFEAVHTYSSLDEHG